MDADVATAPFASDQQRIEHNFIDVPSHDAPLAAELRAGTVVKEDGVLYSLVTNPVAEALATGGDHLGDGRRVVVACLEDGEQTPARAAASAAAISPICVASGTG